MTVKVAINGFGRIGRNVLRAIIESGRTDIEVVAINDLGPVEINAHLLRFDSVHGRFPATVTTTDTTIDVGRGPIEVTAIRNPAELPWKHVDIVLECTGIFTDKEKAKMHLENGASRVLVSAPSKGADKTIVYGVNHDTLTKTDLIVSNASLHDKLPCPRGAGAASGNRHQARFHDHDPQLYRRPADAGYDAQGYVPRPRRRAEHDPDLDRGGKGRGAGAARIERQAGWRRDPGADAQCLGRRSGV